MLARVFAIAMNSYREAVRARILYGLLALALGTTAYSLVVATLSLHQETRVVADIGASSISLFSVLVAIVLGATSLYRELELKTIFPILSRPLRRHEYLIGKYLGAVVTLSVFVAIDAAGVLMILALQGGQAVWKVLVTAALLGGILAVRLVRARFTRVFVLIPWSYALLLSALVLSAPVDEWKLVFTSAVLTICEVAIVSAVATLFSSFSSPFLTAVYTLGVFLVGRSADSLAHLPPRVFGELIPQVGLLLSHVFPNLNTYVPPRPLLLGQDPGHPVLAYVGNSAMYALFYTTALLTLSAIIFRRRDFQ
jgi:Cu-processing system permease protein